MCFESNITCSEKGLSISNIFFLAFKRYVLDVLGQKQKVERRLSGLIVEIFWAQT